MLEADKVKHYLRSVWSSNEILVGLIRLMIQDEKNVAFNPREYNWMWLNDPVTREGVTIKVISYYCAKYNLLRLFDKDNKMIKFCENVVQQNETVIA